VFVFVKDADFGGMVGQVCLIGLGRNGWLASSHWDGRAIV